MAASEARPGTAGPRVRQNQKAWKYIRDVNSASSTDMNRIAIRAGKKNYTYGQMFRQWDRYASVFSALGMTGERHARVGLIGNICPEVIFAMYGLNMVGAEVSMLYEIWTLRLSRVMNTVRDEKLTDIIVTDLLAPPGLALELLQRKEELGLHNVIFLHVPVDGSDVNPALSAAQEAKYLYLKAWYAPVCMEILLKAWGDSAVRYAPDESSDTAFIVHTSGTTSGNGMPVVLSDRAFNAVGACFSKMDSLPLPLDNLVSMVVVDLSNAYGVVDQVHLPLCMGGTIVVTNAGAFNPGLYKLIPEAGVTFLFSINVMFEQWMKLPASTAFDFSSLRFVAIGGAAVSAKDKRRYYEFLRSHGCGEIPLVNGYGVSELGGACCLSSADLDDESIGHLLPDVELRLYDEENGKYYSLSDAPCEGVLYLHSPSMMTPALDGRTVTETVTLDGKRFVCTNDAVRVDTDGKLTYLGRSNRYFLHGGVKYEAGRVETEFARQAGIESCCVAPVYDKGSHDNLPMLCVRPLEAEGGADQAAEAVRQALVRVFVTEMTLPEDQIPNRVLIADELPRNANGKIDLYRITRGEVSGTGYYITPVRLLDQVVDFRLTQPNDGPVDMVQDTFRMLAEDLKEELPFHTGKTKTQEENPMKKNANPLACFKAMNEMGRQMWDNMLKQANSVEGAQNPFAELQEKAAPEVEKAVQQGLKSMSDMLAQMKKVNEKGWEAMQKMHEQDRQMMEKLNESLQKIAAQEEKKEDGEPAPAEESSEKSPESDCREEESHGKNKRNRKNR